MFKKIRKKFKEELKQPSLDIEVPSATLGFSVMGNEAAERRDANQLALDRANFLLQKEALEKNLRLTHRSTLIAFAGVSVALLIGIIGIILAITTKPNSTVIQISSPKVIQVRNK